MDAVWNVFFASGYILKMLLFAACFLAVCFLHGVFWSRLLKHRAHIFEFCGLGLIGLLALEEFLCWPVVAYRLSSGLLTGLTLGVIALPAAGAFLLPPKGGFRAALREERVSRLLAAAVLALVLLTAAASAFEYRANSDDSLYVSNIALFAVSDRVNPYDASMGDVTARTIPMYDFQVWEALLSVLCRVFGLKATETAHTLVMIPLILCSASAYFSLGRALTKDGNKALVFVAAITVFHLGCRQIAYSEGVFLLARTWQGKSVNLTVTLPVLSAAVLGHFDRDKTDKSLFQPALVLLCVFSGMALNATSLYVNGFELLFLSLAAAVMTKDLRQLAHMIPATAATLIFTLMLYFRVRAGQGILESSGTAEAGFFAEAAGNVFGRMKVFLVMYFGALIYAFFRGNGRVKAYFLIAGALMLAFLWNPAAGVFVAEKITKIPTYWRVFWLVPLGAAVAWCVSDLVFLAKGRRAAALGLALLALLTYAGEESLREYTPADNVEKMRPKILEMGAEILSDGNSGPVLACNSVSTALRQEYTDIVLLVAKEGFIRDLYHAYGRAEEGDDLVYLYRFANATLNDGEYDRAGELMDKYGVGCVILRVGNKEGLAVMKDLKWTLADKGDGYMMYYRPSGVKQPGKT